MSNFTGTVPTTQAHIKALAADMRKSDVEEVWASNRMTPLQALKASTRLSMHSWTCIIKGDVVCIFGVGRTSFLNMDGMLWLLGSNSLEKHAIPFLRNSKVWIDQLKDQFPRLRGIVDVNNQPSIDWIRWLGFDFGDPIAIGPDGMMFYPTVMLGNPELDFARHEIEE